MKIKDVFKLILSGSTEQTVLPRQNHISGRAMLSVLQGLEKKFVEDVERLARVDPQLRQYIDHHSAEDIAKHLRYLLWTQEVAH